MTAATAARWSEANTRFLSAEIEGLRARIERRVLWLRSRWKADPLQPYQGLVISDAQVDRLLAQSGREDEFRFYQEDPEALRLTQKGRSLQEQAVAAADEALHAGSPPPLEILCTMFGISAFDRRVLLLAFAPEMNAEFEKLYAYLHDDVTHRQPTLHLAMSLLDEEEANGGAHWNCFLPESPLWRFRLLQVENGSGTARGAEPLRMNRRIVDYILGFNRPEASLASVLRPVDAPEMLTPVLQELSVRLEKLVTAAPHNGHVPSIHIVGRPDRGSLMLARALAWRLGVELFAVEPLHIPPSGRERREICRLLEREAVMLPAAYYLDLARLEAHSRGDQILAADLLDEVRAFFIVAARERSVAQGHAVVVPLPLLTSHDQLELWKKAIASSGGSSGGTSDDFLREVTQQFDLGPKAIHSVLSTARGFARLEKPEENAEVTPAHVWKSCRFHAAQSMEGLAQRITSSQTWEDIVLPDDTLLQLRELAAQVAHRSRVYDEWGFGARLTRGRGINALFAGASGTGKTLAAEILAHHLQLELFKVDLAGVVSKYIGETEKNLRKVFDAAEQSGAILFFDEADALFGKRSEVKDSHDRYANLEISYLLQKMEEYRGLAILASNMKSMLDQAFLRRLRYIVDFPLPDAPLRARIWRGVFPKEAALDGLDFDFLARLYISGGNIRNIALNSAFLAAQENKPIRMDHVLHAARREYSKMDKLMLESEFGPYLEMVHR